MRCDDFDPPTGLDRNPYESPRAPIDPVRPVDSFDVGPGALSVRHDLNDADLRLWSDFDAFYDPTPLFGVVPQWVVLAVVLGLFGGVLLSSRGTYPLRAAVGGPLVGLLAPAVLAALAALNRRVARRSGYCDGRTLRVGLDRLTLETGPITGGGPSFNLGPTDHPWAQLRKVEGRDGAIFFWVRGLERRRRLVLPRRAFATPTEADAFLAAAVAWHAAATGARQ